MDIHSIFFFVPCDISLSFSSLLLSTIHIKCQHHLHLTYLNRTRRRQVLSAGGWGWCHLVLIRGTNNFQWTCLRDRPWRRSAITILAQILLYGLYAGYGSNCELSRGFALRSTCFCELYQLLQACGIQKPNIRYESTTYILDRIIIQIRDGL